MYILCLNPNHNGILYLRNFSSVEVARDHCGNSFNHRGQTLGASKSRPAAGRLNWIQVRPAQVQVGWVDLGMTKNLNKCWWHGGYRVGRFSTKNRFWKRNVAICHEIFVSKYNFLQGEIYFWTSLHSNTTKKKTFMSKIRIFLYESGSVFLRTNFLYPERW
jgi:hypothetical protein